jgi:hypothetical protein
MPYPTEPVTNRQLREELCDLRKEILPRLDALATAVADLQQREAACAATQTANWDAHLREHKSVATNADLVRLQSGVANGRKALDLAHRNEVTTAKLAAIMGGSGTVGGLIVLLFQHIPTLFKALAK